MAGRFDLAPGRFEIEVLAPKDVGRARPRNLSRNGILFASPEPLEVGEALEVRLVEGETDAGRPLRVRGRVVRLEEVPPPEGTGEGDAYDGARPGIEDRYEVGVAFDLGESRTEVDLLEFLDLARSGRRG